MKKTLTDWWFPSALAVAGLFLAYFFQIKIGGGYLYLSSTITLSSVLVAFSSTFIAVLINGHENHTILAMKRNGFFISILSLIRVSTMSFIALIVCSLLGFRFYEMPGYSCIHLALTGFAIGSFIQVVNLLIALGLYMGKQELKKEKERKNSAIY